MSDLTAITGVSMPLVHKGETYNIHAWTDELRARYIQWAKSYAMQTLRGLQKAGVFSPAEYQEAFNGLRRDLVNGEYNFGREPIRSLMGTPDGTHILVRVLLNNDAVQDDVISELIAERGEELFTIIESLNGGKTDDEDEVDTSDPKAKTPA